MKRIADSSGELAWVQSSGWRRDCDLRDGSDLVATLRWQSSFQATAVGQTFEGFWHFKLEGFLFRQWVRISSDDHEGERTVFQAHPSFNGVLEYADGRAFYWDSNFWLTKWIWTDEKEMELIRVQRSLSLKAEGHMEIEPGLIQRPELPLLTLLGWYLIMVVSDVRPGSGRTPR